MKFNETAFKGIYLVEYFSMIDDRGLFMKPWVRSEINTIFGENFETYFSSSEKGTIRGLHYQKGKSAQSKFIICLKGSIEDFATDLRANSKTYGQTFRTTILPGEQGIIVPEGFAHGIYANEDSLIVNFCNNDYDASAEAGINWKSIDVLSDLEVSSISDKDLALPELKDVI